MKRILALVSVLIASPAYADSLGSATGGQAGNQSNLSGGLCQSAPIALSNGQQASFLIDCNTHALITEGTGGGGGSSVVLLPGSAIAGKFGIDQTTPGTTNGVQTLSGSVENSTLQAGSAIVGKVGIDQTTPGITNGVQTLAGSVTTLSAATHVQTTALAANQIIVAGAHNLTSFDVAADSTLSGAAWWIMIYDATSAPTDGAVTPAKCYALPSGATSFNGAFNSPPAFTTGIVIGVSTTGCFTKTSSAHAFISGDFQ